MNEEIKRAHDFAKMIQWNEKKWSEITKAINSWAADDRLWNTQETVARSLDVFIRAVVLNPNPVQLNPNYTAASHEDENQCTCWQEPGTINCSLHGIIPPDPPRNYGEDYISKAQDETADEHDEIIQFAKELWKLAENWKIRIKRYSDGQNGYRAGYAGGMATCLVQVENRLRPLSKFKVELLKNRS